MPPDLSAESVLAADPPAEGSGSVARAGAALRWVLFATGPTQAVLCMFVPLAAAVIAGEHDLTLVAAVIFGFVAWVTIEVARKATWLSPLAVGTRVIVALAILAMLPLLLVVDDLLPGHLTIAELATVAIPVLLWSIAVAEPSAERSKPRSVVVIGGDGGGAELARILRASSDLPFTCPGLVVETRAENGAHPNGTATVGTASSNGDAAGRQNGDAPPVLGTVADLTSVLISCRPDLVVFAGDSREAPMARLLDAEPLDLRVLSLADFYEHAFGRVPVELVGATWFMSVLHLYRRPYPRFAKRTFDIAWAGIALILVLPLLPVIALLVRATTPGPVLFRQTRIGEGGKLFQILKFRTMVQDAERDGRALWAEENDARVTTVGRVLRTSRLDELPQLWNVLRGDMSIVGPRPERPEFLSVLAEAVPHWTRRHLVKPGITGWAQVRLGYTSDPVAAVDKLSYDLYYLKHRSLVLDLVIAVKTAGILLSGSGAK